MTPAPNSRKKQSLRGKNSPRRASLSSHRKNVGTKENNAHLAVGRTIAPPSGRRRPFGPKVAFMESVRRNLAGDDDKEDLTFEDKNDNDEDESYNNEDDGGRGVPTAATVDNNDDSVPMMEEAQPFPSDEVEAASNSVACGSEDDDDDDDEDLTVEDENGNEEHVTVEGDDDDDGGRGVPMATANANVNSVPMMEETQSFPSDEVATSGNMGLIQAASNGVACAREDDDDGDMSPDSEDVSLAGASPAGAGRNVICRSRFLTPSRAKVPPAPAGTSSARGKIPAGRNPRALNDSTNEL